MFQRLLLGIGCWGLGGRYLSKPITEELAERGDCISLSISLEAVRRGVIW